MSGEIRPDWLRVDTGSPIGTARITRVRQVDAAEPLFRCAR